MNIKNNQAIGLSGEEAAAKYLTSKGFRIIERNFQKRYGEIDIVAMEGDTLVFVEVKTRLGDKFGTPEESITPWKLHSLIRSVNYYRMLHPDLGESMRIDLVSVTQLDDDRFDINHYENISG